MSDKQPTDAEENGDFVEKWEKILQGIEFSRVELKYVRKLRFKLQNRRQQTVNIENLWRKGMTEEQVQKHVILQFETLADLIVDVEFVIDIPILSSVIQPETDNILNNLS